MVMEISFFFSLSFFDEVIVTGTINESDGKICIPTFRPIVVQSQPVKKSSIIKSELPVFFIVKDLLVKLVSLDIKFFKSHSIIGAFALQPSKTANKQAITIRILFT